MGSFLKVLNGMHRMFAIVLALVAGMAGEVVLAQDDGGASGSYGSGSGNRHGSRRSNSSRNAINGGSSSGNQMNEDQQRRSRSRRESSRRRDSNLPGGLNKKSPDPKAAGTPAPGKDGKQQRVLKGKTPAKAASGGGGKAGTASSAPPVEFKMQPNPNVNILYIEGLSGTPTLNMQAVEGKTFSSRVALRNARQSRFQDLEFSIKYNPEVVQPIGIDDEDNAPLLAGESRATVDSRKGILHYRASLEEPRQDDDFEIARIQWKAVGPSANSPLVFLNTPNNPSRVEAPDGANILQMRDEDGEVEVSERTGLLDASVAVAPGEQTTAAMADSRNSITMLTLANSISQGTAEGGMSFSLRPRTTQVQTGEDFLVDVVFANPRRAEMDMLRMTIRFDPQVLEVVDHDEENWISRGVNIYDGDYHEELPFDYHLKNVAYNSTGEIRYEMGFSNRTQIPAAGTVATIRFRAKAPSPQTVISFDLDEETGSPATTASFLGFNLIGTPGQRASALTGASIAIN